MARKDGKKEPGIAWWNSAISTAGTPSGLRKRQWTVQGAAARFRLFSANGENAWSTRTLPVREKREVPEGFKGTRLLTRVHGCPMVRIRISRRYQR
jgi:hypothetical protein